MRWIQRQTAGGTVDALAGTSLLRSAVSSNLCVVAREMAHLLRRDEAVADRIADARKLVRFRDRLVGNGSPVDDQTLYDVITQRLPTVRRDLERLLS